MGSGESSNRGFHCRRNAPRRALPALHCSPERPDCIGYASSDKAVYERMLGGFVSRDQRLKHRVQDAQSSKGKSGLQFGARGRGRTGTALRPRDFKSLASTCFATRASCGQAGNGLKGAGMNGRNWRLGSELNRRTRSCSPLHDHSATQPEGRHCNDFWLAWGVLSAGEWHKSPGPVNEGRRSLNAAVEAAARAGRCRGHESRSDRGCHRGRVSRSTAWPTP